MVGSRTTGRERSCLCRAVTGLAVALIGLGAAGFCLPVAAGTLHWIAGPCASSSFELPNDPALVAVDGEGRIFACSPHYQRMQVYSPGGDFLRGWFMRSDAYVSSFDPARASITVVYLDDTELEFDVYGHILRQVHVPGTFAANWANHRGFFACADGVDCTRYHLKHHSAWAQIARTDADGERLVVGQPLPISVIRMPFPSFLYVVLGMLLLPLRRHLLRCPAKSPPNGPETPAAGEK